MDRQYEPIRRFLQRVRARRRALSALEAVARAALALSAVVAVALAVWSLASLGGRSPIALAGLLASCSCWPRRRSSGGCSRSVARRPTRARAVHRRAGAGARRSSGDGRGHRPARHAVAPDRPACRGRGPPRDAIDLDEVVPGRRIRAGGFKAGAAAIALLVLAVMAREPARQSLDAASLALFPERVRLEFVPGNARVLQGAPLTIQARLVGNRAPVGARLEVGCRRPLARHRDAGESGGGFRLAMPPATADFKYRVVAGSITSPVYRVTVAHPPRVTRIDVDYAYPPALGLPPRTETDSGDVYAPAGTDVTLHVHTDRPLASGQLSLANGRSMALSAGSPTQLTAAMKVVEDGAYRIALGISTAWPIRAQNEYFIRAIEDRPPDVHVVKPASDRSVTRLEEVDIEAQADDDYGIERMELVYAVRGQSESVIPLDVPRRGTSVTARHTIYLEDLDVRPGDFVSYYVRARDITRGPVERRAERHLLPGSQAVRAGICAGAKPVDGGRRLQRVD